LPERSLLNGGTVKVQDAAALVSHLTNHFMDLSRLDSEIAIATKLAAVQSSLKALDKLEAQAQKLEAEHAKLKAQETAILKEEFRSDESKLDDLLRARAAIDLKQSAIDALRGRPSAGNNQPAISGKIVLAEEAVHNAGEVASQFLRAFHQAVLVQLEATIAETTKGVHPSSGHQPFDAACEAPSGRASDPELGHASFSTRSPSRLCRRHYHGAEP
jgi:hypothetical protein